MTAAVAQLLSLLGIGFSVWMAVDAFRNGKAYPWIWLILFLPPFGALGYFALEIAGPALGRFRFDRPRVSGADLAKAELDVRRLDTAAAWTDYASLLRQKGRAREALAAAEEGLRRNEGSRDARYERGQARRSTGDAAGAVADLAPVVASDDDYANGEALLALARAREASGDLAGARRDLERLVERHSATANLYELGRVQAAAGDPAAADATLQRLIDEYAFVPRYLRGQVRPWVWKAKALRRRLDRTPAASGGATPS